MGIKGDQGEYADEADEAASTDDRQPPEPKPEPETPEPAPDSPPDEQSGSTTAAVTDSGLTDDTNA